MVIEKLWEIGDEYNFVKWFLLKRVIIFLMVLCYEYYRLKDGLC